MPTVLSNWASAATIFAALLTAASLLFAGIQVHYSRRASSASSVISLHESFRQAWLEYTKASEKDKQHAFSDIMNLLETSCAAYYDRAFVGHSKIIFEEYLCDVLKAIDGGADTKPRIEQMVQSPQTFEYVQRFMRQHGKRTKADCPALS